MPASKTIIPVHQLDDATDKGFVIRRMPDPDKQYAADTIRQAHRDDHYVFCLQETGSCQVSIDFKEHHVTGEAALYILPGQVHHYRLGDGIAGWFLAVDTMLVGPKYRAVFEEEIMENQPLQLCPVQKQRMIACLELLYQVYHQPAQLSFTKNISHALLLSFIGMMAAAYSDYESATAPAGSRPAQITRAFKKLLVSQCTTVKSPAEYAAQLNISLSYLNETIKKTTGQSVSYWIHYEVMLEARRLLYHSDLSVKEIAYQLGYEDHTYFSRVFRKNVQMTPGSFRSQYRE
jgi:AraC-like DNA-binding protein